MKLELKHLSQYLPYSLKYKDIPEGYTDDRTLDAHTIDWALNNGKPILRPLSDLSEEIEVNGDKFIPIVELLKLKFPQQEKEGRYSKITVGESPYPTAWFTLCANKEIMIQLFSYETLPYWIVEKLFEWHFDFFNLIYNKLAVDINCL